MSLSVLAFFVVVWWLSVILSLLLLLVLSLLLLLFMTIVISTIVTVFGLFFWTYISVTIELQFISPRRCVGVMWGVAR